MQKIVITVSGHDQPGMVAAISLVIAKCRGNILDLTQRISGQHFVMLLVVDIQNAIVDLEVFQKILEQIAKELNIKINIQHQDVFRYMHRITP
ncbi:ACT domain-containing protein [Candidatus Riflebacteria bacterium]